MPVKHDYEAKLKVYAALKEERSISKREKDTERRWSLSCWPFGKRATEVEEVSE
jgi:hypothetical protein